MKTGHTRQQTGLKITLALGNSFGQLNFPPHKLKQELYITVQSGPARKGIKEDRGRVVVKDHDDACLGGGFGQHSEASLHMIYIIDGENPHRI